MKNEVNQLGISSLINKRTGDWPTLALHTTWNQEIDRSLSHLSVSHYHPPPPSPPHHHAGQPTPPPPALSEIVISFSAFGLKVSNP